MSTSADHFYKYDDIAVAEVRNQKSWMGDPKHFTKVVVSPSALIKMMMHGQSGVDKGVSKGGNPIEVMGLLVGRPDVVDPHTLVISDAQPLPIEGFETRVDVANDESVLSYMIDLGTTLASDTISVH